MLSGVSPCEDPNEASYPHVRESVECVPSGLIDPIFGLVLVLATCRSFANQATGTRAAPAHDAPGVRVRRRARQRSRAPFLATLLNRAGRVPTVYGGVVGDTESTTCPTCGKGTLRTVDFGDQQPESRQVQTFTCGHEVEGDRLQTADADRLDVERRGSEETVTPVDPQE